ncbi:MAG TPA: FAD-dependent oxidoreductase, partial [Aggregatilineales bacterium]|nr:FAD-dependent oxidoreductase [Aggregatilineales bacterium]
VLEKRDILGGKWSSWKDGDGEWVETGLHVFFGAYDEIFTLMKELNLYDRILWKEHVLTYTLDEGERFEFRTAKLPSPLHLLPTLLRNRYFTWSQKLSLARNLYPILFGSPPYYRDMDYVSYQQWHLQHGISDRLLQKMFLPLSLALKFVAPKDISAKIVLDVSGIFLRVNQASRIGFLKGSPEVHLIGPMAQYVRDHGGTITTNARIVSIETGPDGTITGLCVQNGDGTSQSMIADKYVMALPIHNLQRILPPRWLSDPYFEGLSKIEGVPVVSVHLWCDRQISYTDNILFSPDGVIPVYADMANTTPDYRTNGNGTMTSRNSRFQFVVAPAHDLIHQDDETILDQVWDSVQRSFPATAKDAGIEKYRIVRVPHSVYWPKPGLDRYRVPQKSPVENLFLAGGYTIQRFYDSMEGAVRSGNRAAAALIAGDRHEDWQAIP